MAWSYRQDRADEVYASTSGPAAATTEQMPRPPMDGEDTDSVLNPEVPEPKKGETPQAFDPEAPKPPTLTVEEQAVKYQQEQAKAKGQPDQPAPAPSAEEQQKAIDAARGGASEKKAEHAAAKK